LISTTVAADGIGQAFDEVLRELRNMGSSPPRGHELEGCRRYAVGSFLLGFSSQAKLADLAMALLMADHALEYLTWNAARLAAVIESEVADASWRYLSPAGAVAVVLGDADRLRPYVSGPATVLRL
jgi:predicted Zn-dependent peptidase